MRESILELELEVTVEWTYSPGYSGTATSFKHWESPPDSDEATVKHVWLWVGEKRIDIKESLSVKDIQRLETDLCEERRED